MENMKTLLGVSKRTWNILMLMLEILIGLVSMVLEAGVMILDHRDKEEDEVGMVEEEEIQEISEVEMYTRIDNSLQILEE